MLLSIVGRCAFKFDVSAPPNSPHTEDYRHLARSLLRRGRGMYGESAASIVCSWAVDWIYNRPTAVEKWLKLLNLFFQLVVSVAGVHFECKVPISGFELGWHLYAALPRDDAIVSHCAITLLEASVGTVEGHGKVLHGAEQSAWLRSIGQAEPDVPEAAVGAWSAEFRRRLMVLFAADLRDAVEPENADALLTFVTSFDGAATLPQWHAKPFVSRLLVLNLALPRLVKSACIRLANESEAIAETAFHELSCSSLLEPIIAFSRAVFALGPSRPVAYSLLLSAVIISDLQVRRLIHRPAELGIIELVVWMTTSASYLRLVQASGAAIDDRARLTPQARARATSGRP